MHSLHPLELGLRPIPVAFDVLGVYPSYWINEVKGVVSGSLSHGVKLAAAAAHDCMLPTRHCARLSHCEGAAAV